MKAYFSATTTRHNQLEALMIPETPSTPIATVPTPPATPRPIENLRLRRVERDAVIDIPARLENLLPSDHLARLVWDVAKQLDLSAFYADIEVADDCAGRPATDPLILVALWVYASLQGVMEARVLARLCVEHLAYIWLCGGVSTNYHTLSDFRVKHEAALDDLLTRIVQHLDEQGLVGWEAQAQDGMRVRASAGAASFHRQPTLERSLAKAEAEVAALEAEPQAETVLATPGEQAARERAAQERVERLEAALQEISLVKTAKPEDKRAQVRVSSTDPQARVMKMGDGGFRPAYNWEFSTDTANRVIMGVDVVNKGSDRGQMEPMLLQIVQRYARLPQQWMVDGGFVKLEALEEWSSKVCILAPVPTPKDKTRDPYQPLLGDSPAIAAWRERMGTPAAKTAYKLRAATAECVNAQARTQEGVQQSTVRGQGKNRCLALWVAIAHNLWVWIHKLGTATGPQQSSEQGCAA
jgi:transposase